VIVDGTVSPRWSSRAQERMSLLREDYAFLGQDNETVLIPQGSNEIRWFTFAGNTHNLALADAIRNAGFDDVKTSDFGIRICSTPSVRHLFEILDSLTAEQVWDDFNIPEDYLEHLKFSECLPHKLAAGIMKTRLLDIPTLKAILSETKTR